ncbi:hypothetical protein KP509_24G053400 [Ceratopteris richardii]|uniref:Uncharacterized protein n=1 Tax=Ceratopteris richardii TaxID=49495 RepID=A0A8T2RWK4_CERRI|nr:hypothetical protein KP509_24G053400 [Ceratopteris richardii]
MGSFNNISSNLQLRTCSKDDQVKLICNGVITNNITTLLHLFNGCAMQKRKLLVIEGKSGRPLSIRSNNFLGTKHFIPNNSPKHQHIGHCSEACQMLYGLMSNTVFN